jgi:hypothetical protein
MGDRMLIAIIAITHVIINHALAVGFIPIVTLMEYRGYRERVNNEKFARDWDNLGYKLLFFAFIITTSLGAMTGVGIWFSTALVSPAAIGSLIRVFFGAWFIEWIIFVLEVVAIMYYFLSWKKSNKDLKTKKNHVRVGLALSIFSWLTMAIIVGILGFMMDTGSWLQDKTLVEGFVNPIYLPQLAFRTPMAFVMGGAVALFLTIYHLKRTSEFRKKVLRNLSLWMFVWTPHVLAAGIYYHYKIPEMMLQNIPVALATQQYQQWYDSILYFLIIAVVISMIAAVWAGLFNKRVSKLIGIIPLIATLLTIGTFERVREFIRKPFVIEEYMYSNQIHVDNYSRYQKEGILGNAIYTSVPEVTDDNLLEAGENVFMISCSRCHTTHGINSVVTKFEDLFAPKGGSLKKKQLTGYIPVMHKSRYFMPPFPGNQKELQALATYIVDQQTNPRELPGAQSAGVNISPLSEHNFKLED